MRRMFLATGIVTLANGDKVVRATLAMSPDRESALEGFRESAKTDNPDMIALRFLDCSEVPEAFVREAAAELGMCAPFSKRATVGAQ